ncbi:MAG: sodium:solute symporter [Clostridia bacterium]|nr:sodium:solute symporter [Clostridia bacterium]
MVEKIALLAVFFIATLALGIVYKKKIHSMDDFVLGGRSVGPWLTAFSYGTSYFSAVVFIGYSGQFGWSFGISAFWIGIANALLGSLAAWVVLGKRTRTMTKHLGAATMPDFFSKRYNSKALKLVSALIIFIFLVPYSASVYKGLSGIFSMAFGIDFKYCIIGMAVLTCVYVVLGGYMAAAANNFVQGMIMLGGIVAVVIAVLNGKGGFTEAVTALSQVEVAEGTIGEGMKGAYTSIFGPDPLSLLGVMILTSLGTWGLPQMIHKFYTIDSEKSITKGAIISTIFAFVVAGGSYFIGGFGRLYVQSGEGGMPSVAYDEIMPNMLEGVLPDILMGLVVVLVLSASMSTLSSLVISSASTLTVDFFKGFIKKDMKDNQQMIFTRIFCVIFMVISVVLALFPGTLITNLMAISWGALSGAFLAPFMYGLYSKKITNASVWVSFIAGIGFIVLNMFIKFMSGTSAGAVSMLITLVLVPVVSLITKKPEQEHVDKCFSCYNNVD